MTWYLNFICVCFVIKNFIMLFSVQKCYSIYTIELYYSNVILRVIIVSVPKSYILLFWISKHWLDVLE